MRKRFEGASSIKTKATRKAVAINLDPFSMSLLHVSQPTKIMPVRMARMIMRKYMRMPILQSLSPHSDLVPVAIFHSLKGLRFCVEIFSPFFLLINILDIVFS